MLMSTNYYLTNAGLAAALHDEKLHETLKQALQGEAKAEQVARLVKDKLIAPDKRPVPIDNTQILLHGVVARVREVLGTMSNGHTPEGKGEDTDPVEDLRTVPRKLYRLRSNQPRQTPEQLRALPSGARRVYTALLWGDVGTTKSLAEATKLNRRTVENSLGALRKAGLIEDIDYTR